MTDSIKTGDISDSEAIVIGHGSTAIVTHEHHYTPPQFPLDNLPPPNPNFTGRAELLETITANFPSSSSSGSSFPVVITQAIAGLGGVGKTQLALAYAHAHKSDYDLIWLLRADEAAALDGDLRQLGAALRLRVQTVDAPTARQMVLGWLNGGRKRWLLLYDNADKMKPGELRAYLPGGGGHVLITSRQPRWKGAQTLRLDVFTATEAAKFWPRRLELELEREEESALAELAVDLGYLPLAMEQAAAYMATKDKTAAQYLALYRERRRALWERQPAPEDYDKTITTTWELGFEHARQTPGAADLLNLCCFLAPDDIPLAMITAHAKALPEELAAALADELARDAALAALTNYSLITQADGALTMHRLVQTVARNQMGEERTKIWLEAAMEFIVALLPDWTRLHAWNDGPRILTHMIAAADSGFELAWETERLAFLCNWIGYLLQFYADYAAAKPYYERALEISERVLGPDHPDTARSLNNLAILSYYEKNMPEAARLMRRALAIWEKKLGANHPQTQSARETLSVIEAAL